MNSPATPALFALPKEALIPGLREKFQQALARGSRDEAGRLLEEGVEKGLRTKSLYLSIILPALQGIAELAERGDITETEKQVAAQITLDEMARMRTRHRAKAPLQKRVVVIPLSDDLPSLCAQIVSDLLVFDGWTSDVISKLTPAEDLATFVRRRPPHLLALCAMCEETAARAGAVIAELRALSKCPKILLVKGWEHSGQSPSRIDADMTVFDLKKLCSSARSLIGIDGCSSCLEQYLQDLGRRIQKHRKIQRLSQQQLAEASGLDRTYLSSVEHGKQNVTLGVISKIAEALEVEIEELLGADCE